MTNNVIIFNGTNLSLKGIIENNKLVLFQKERVVGLNFGHWIYLEEINTLLCQEVMKFRGTFDFTINPSVVKKMTIFISV